MAWIVYAARYIAWLVGGLRRRLRTPPPYVSFLLESAEPELPPPPAPRWRRILAPPGRNLRQLTEQMRMVGQDARIRGVVLHLRPVDYTPAQVETLAALILDVRRAGKRTICWSTSYNDATYRLACAADEVLLQPGGTITGLGPARSYTYLADALSRIGVSADFCQVSPYKTAADTLTRTGMSPEAREMAGWLADAELESLVWAIAGRKGIGNGEARALVDASPFTDLTAREAEMVDAVVSEEELPARLGGEVGTWDRASRSLRRRPPFRPGRRYVGIIRVEGMILDGRSRRPPIRPPLPVPYLFNSQTGDLTVVQQARRLARDPRAAAVVLWIDSPGGSATASEAMHAALRRLAARKPLIAAMGSVAASGGYYVATPAQRIFAQQGSVTGSIGVLAGKIVMGGLLDRLQIGHETVARGEHAAMDMPEEAYTETERAKLRESVSRMYDLFLERVAAGRQRAVSAIEPIAGGRVWTGRQALEHGLVDQAGGLEHALVEARRIGGLRSDAPVVELGGEPETPPLTPVAATLEHAGALASALGRTGAWLLCPLIRS
ncbi:MAG TPA: signal peptide peptidase SppA [Candidatus Dormibacteraeota bacterium]|jgi:protease-4|nr:signal peptide peptidase SppA [Candidatus Dormibacteraeota bacterium]